MSLVSVLQTAFTRVGTEFKSVRTQAFGGATADASTLTTTSKNLLGAINEINARPVPSGSINGSSDVTPAGTKATGDILRYNTATSKWEEVPGASYFQPLDSDLTAIAALSTTAYGQSLLTLASAAALTAGLTSATSALQGAILLASQTEVNAGVEATKAVTSATLAGTLSGGYQPLDSDLTSIAALSTTTYGRALLTLAGQAGLMGLLSVGTTGAAGILQLATSAQAATGTDTALATTAAGVKAAIDQRIVNDATLTTGATTTNAPSMAAVKAYADGLLDANNGLQFKGSIDASANPNYPAASAGWQYRISVAGKIGGASGPNVEVNDTLYCIVDSTAAGTQASVGAAWVIVQTNIDGAVTGPASSTAANIATFSGTSGKVVQDSGFAVSATTPGAGSTFTVPTGAAAYAAITNYAQPVDAELSALAGLVSAADRVPYFTGSGTAALATLTTFARSLISAVDVTAAQTTLQVYSQTTIGDPATDFTAGFVAALS